MIIHWLFIVQWPRFGVLIIDVFGSVRSQPTGWEIATFTKPITDDRRTRMVTAGPAGSGHIAYLELRQRALVLQRRRFWREVTYGLVMVGADVLTLFAVFAVLGILPLSQTFGGLGEDGTAFVRGLIPQTPTALARRVALLVFSLIVTRCYAHTERDQHPPRMAASPPLRCQ